MSAGKGDSPRSCFSREYRDNWDQIFAQRRRDAEEEDAGAFADITGTPSLSAVANRNWSASPSPKRSHVKKTQRNP